MLERCSSLGEFDPAQEPLRETLCTLGNDYFATHGAVEEASAGEIPYPGTVWLVARTVCSPTLNWRLPELSSPNLLGSTAPEGIRLGAMAGTVDLVQRGQSGLLKPIRLEFAIQRGHADVQRPGSCLAVAATLLKGLHDCRTFDLG